LLLKGPTESEEEGMVRFNDVEEFWMGKEKVMLALVLREGRAEQGIPYVPGSLVLGLMRGDIWA